MTPTHHADDVTLGEIYRRLLDIDERHGDQLAQVIEQQKIANGRTTRLEARSDGHDRELRDIRLTPRPVDGPPVAVAIPPEIAELLSLARSAKGVLWVGRTGWAIAGALGPLILWWLSSGGKLP
jgi:hypothetical protein